MGNQIKKNFEFDGMDHFSSFVNNFIASAVGMVRAINLGLFVHF